MYVFLVVEKVIHEVGETEIEVDGDELEEEDDDEDEEDAGEFTIDICGIEGTTDIEDEIGKEIAEISDAVVSTGTANMSTSSSMGWLVPIGTSGCEPPNKSVTRVREDDKSPGG